MNRRRSMAVSLLNVLVLTAAVAVADKGITRYSGDAARPQLKVATEIDFGRFTNEFVRALLTVSQLRVRNRDNQQ